MDIFGLNNASALNRDLLNKEESYQKHFSSDEPLSNFLVVDDFLEPVAFENLLDFVLRAEMTDYTVQIQRADGSLQGGYMKKEPGLEYFSTHRRMAANHGLPAELQELFGDKGVLSFLSAVTDVALTQIERPGTLTGWNPGDFLGPHTDEKLTDPQTKVVVSLSLTRGWEERFGGLTYYSWLGSKKRLLVVPQANSATIFKPGQHSFHWVSRLTEEAPVGRRFTLTIDYH